MNTKKKFFTIFLIQFWRLNLVLLILLSFISCVYFVRSGVCCCCGFRFLFVALDTCMTYSQTVYFFSAFSTLSCLCYIFASTVKRITSFFTRDMSHALVYVCIYVFFSLSAPEYTYYLTNAKGYGTSVFCYISCTLINGTFEWRRRWLG